MNKNWKPLFLQQKKNLLDITIKEKLLCGIAQLEEWLIAWHKQIHEFNTQQYVNWMWWRKSVISTVGRGKQVGQ